MMQEKMTVRDRGRGLDLDQPHIDASVELRNIPLGGLPSSGQPTMTFYLEQRIGTLTREILRLEQLVYNLSDQVESLRIGEQEDTSQVLDLQPLSRTRVNAQVRKYNEPARLEIVEEIEDTDPEASEE